MAAETEKVEPGDSEQDEDEVEDVYEVERIIDMRIEGGDVLYRVRWKNYCSDDDTWEPEAHLEDCREVLLAYKRSLAEAKAKKEKEAEAKKSMLPTKSDLFDADSGSDSDKDRPTDILVKKKKKKKLHESEEDEAPLKEKRKKKKDKRKEEMIKPRPAPETDEEEEETAHTPPSPPREKKTELKKRVVDSDEEDNEPVPKKHKKDKGKEGGKHRRELAEEDKKKKSKKERKIESSDDDAEEGKKKKSKKERKIESSDDDAEEGKKKKSKKERKIESSDDDDDDEATAPLEDNLTDGLSESQTDEATAPESAYMSSEKAQSDDKSKQKKSKSELKLKGIKDFIQDKKGKKPDFPSPSQKESSLQKLKSLTSKSREDTAPHSSDSSDSSTLHKKAKSKGQESASAPAKVPFSSASSSSSSSSSVTAARSNKSKEEETKEEVFGQKDAAGSTSFGRFLQDFETKDRARKHAVHQPAATENTKSAKILGRIEKRTKTAKESPSQKSEPEKTEKTKPSDAARPGQSYGFSLDSDEKEGEESSTRSRFGEDTRDRRERPDEVQRPSWDRRTPTDDRRRRREDSEPRLFMACEDNLDTQEPLDSTDKSDKGQATLSLGMDLNLDWMTLEDFQKHLNGEDEILSGPPLSPSELRDAVKSGDYMSVKLALNSKEDYNLDQEACAIDGKRSVEEEKSLIEDRSSSDQFRLGFNTDMENIPRDFDGPADNENIPKEFDSVDAEEVALKEDETVLRSGRLSPNEHNSESNANSLDGKQQSPEQEGRFSGGGSPMELDLRVDQESTSNDTETILREEEKSPVIEEERMDVEQSRIEEAKGSSDEAEGMEGSDSNGTGFNTLSAEHDGATGKAAEVNSKETVKARPARRKKPGEGKQPTRSSSRTSKKVLVTTSSAMDDDEEVSSKKHYCLYCKAAYTHLVKHLERKHSDETDVAHAIHFPKGSKIRQTLLDQIRSKGDYQHNCEVLKNGGEMATRKQPTDSTTSVRDFLPCQYCFAFYRKTELWKHERSCKVKKGEQKPTDATRCRVQSAATRLLPTMEFFTGGCDEIIDIMHQDDISRHVRNDPLICKYGHALSAKHDHHKSQFAYIAQKMRELGRFVLAVNELDSTIQYLHEICLPSRFELAVEGAKKVSGFDPDSSKFKTVSLVSKIGYSLKRAAEIAFGESRMTEDIERERNVKKFIHLLDTDWNGRFSRRALVSANRKQEIKKVEMDKSTLTEDVIKLHIFLKKEGDEAKKELKESPNPSTWRKLSEATLTEVCLFNRSRVGNMGRMLLQTYTSRKSKRTFVPSADQIMKSSKLELELGDNFTRLELEGQCGRNMLVLLTERMVLSIDLLIDNREQAGVQNDNPYVFARSEGSSYIRGSDCFRRAAHDCETKNPESLMASMVREQIASYWQLMSLSEIELDQVAKLVGLSKQECYKLSENPLQLEEVTKRLLKMERTLNSDALQTTADGAVPVVNTSKKKAWSDEEQVAVKRYLGNFITLMKVPGKKECNACISAEPALLGRSWTDVKSYVHNTLQAVRRKYHQRKSEGDVVFLKRPKEDSTRKMELAGDKTSIGTMMAMQPNDYKDESTTIPITTPFPQEMSRMVSPYSPMNSANMALTSRRMIPTFTPLNASDTMMAPTFTSPNARSASMIPTFTPLNAPSPPMVSTFTPLNARNTMVSSFTPLNHPSTSMVSTFTSLSHSTLAYQTSAHMAPTSPRVGPTSAPIMLDRAPTSPHVGPVSPPVGQDRAPSSSHVVPIGAPMVPDRTPVVPTSSSKKPAKAQTSPMKAVKRTKRLWSEEEQVAVRRQLGDLCKLVKAPGKKECDACLAAEPALRSRTWREVKYYVHNTIQSIKKRGTTPTPKRTGGRAQESHNSGMDWDAPVYLSL